MWRFRRIRLLALSVLLVAAIVTVVVGLRKIAPPEAARLLPGADAFVYVDLQWARRATILSGLPQVKRSPDYERFVQDSGVDFERDLEQAALAVLFADLLQAGAVCQSGLGDCAGRPEDVCGRAAAIAGGAWAAFAEPGGGSGLGAADSGATRAGGGVYRECGRGSGLDREIERLVGAGSLFRSGNALRRTGCRR